MRLSRRTMLGGAGVLLGLPLLDAMAPRELRGAAPAPAQRLLCYYAPNGMHMPAWTPTQVGAGFDLPQILAPLAPVRERVLVLSGLANEAAHPLGSGQHACGTAGFLTAELATRSETELHVGVSLDQLHAARVGRATRLPSLQLGVSGGASSGQCDNGFGCGYARNISWATPTRPLPKLTSPQVAFDLMFAGYDPTASAAEVAARRARRSSVLDHVRADADSLRRELGGDDRDRLGEYLAAVRALELRISADSAATCELGEFTPEYLDFAGHVEVMTELMVLALRCDITRTISFMLGNSASNQSYEFIGVPGSHHDLSHHAGDPEKKALLAEIGAWEVAQLTDLLIRLRAVPEGEGTLLDSTLVFFSSELSDGNNHSHDDLPVLLAGAGLAGGRHLAYPDQRPIADLFLRMLDLLGAPQQRFGADGTTPLELE
jgi:hypothetical protein